jgi:uncharacterized protein with ParB-like and HNH nuclease domain
MNFKKDTVLGLFDSSKKSYEVPVYQRAYSWEEKNWKTFLDDLIEQIQGHNDYFFGNLLLEAVVKNKEYDIIDGQQRITTLTIFMRSILNALENRNDLPEYFDFDGRVRIFLKDGGNIKLRPVEYDRACFEELIIDNKKTFPTKTPSQERIKEAKEYFEKRLSEFDTAKIIEILEKTENTELTIIELEGKKDSALMFELENNRGKELTNMEKIKSYFMYQMYVHSKEDEIEGNIDGISNIFKSIYLIINDIKINEDSVLAYHNNAYINGFAYRNLDNVKDKFKKSDEKSDKKIEWIKDYISELNTTFSNIKKFEQSKNRFAQRLNDLKTPLYIYPFIIKGYKYFADDKAKLNTLFHLLEIITFRAKLINSRANIRDRLNKILLNFDGDVDKLKEDVKNKLNDAWYWGDNNIKDYLNGYMYKNEALTYTLWQYENSIQTKGYDVGNFSIKNKQIEHISPQNPTNGTPIETGYEVDDNNQYSEEFTEEYLNCIGNLMLISGSHNASIGNKPFTDKLQTYNKNPLLNQQAEIKDFALQEDNKDVWKSESIDKRHKKIVDFAIENWSFDSIKNT